MFGRSLATVGLAWTLGTAAIAAPTITATKANQSWDVWVTPDVNTFTPGISLKVELDVSIYGSLASASLNSDFWNVNGQSSGNNPFTGGISEGLVVDPTAPFDYQGTIFAAAQSEPFAAAEPMRLLSFKGFAWSFLIGGRTVLPGTPEQYQSSRITQSGTNYDGIKFKKVICPDGDFDCSGTVANGDLTLLLDNWGHSGPPSPVWIGPPPPPAEGVIGNVHLTALLDNWPRPAAAAVPEPASLLLASLALSIFEIGRRRR